MTEEVIGAAHAAAALLKQVHDVITGHYAVNSFQRLDKEPDLLSQHIIGLRLELPLFELFE